MAIQVTRQTERAILRRQLRDETAGPVWTDSVLNECLNEALQLTQSQHLARTTVVLAAVDTTLPNPVLFVLPSDLVRVEAVYERIGTSTIKQPDYERRYDWTVLEDVPGSLLDATQAATVAPGTKVLLLERALGKDGKLVLSYLQQPASWGIATDVNTGADLVSVDLNPSGLAAAEVVLFFRACARRAAFRWASNIVKGADGDLYNQLYASATAEIQQLMQISPGELPQLRYSGGVL